MSIETTQTTETTQATGFAAQLSRAQANKDFSENQAAKQEEKIDFMPETIGGTTETVAADTTTTTTTTHEEAPKKIRLGSREFNSQAELQGYIEQLEATKGRFEAVQSQFVPQQNMTVTQEESLDDLVFTDTKKFVELVKKQAKEELTIEQQRQLQAQRIEDEFYRTYPDLKNAKKLVAIATNEITQDKSLAAKSQSELFSLIAQAARNEVRAIRGETGASQELSSAPARVAGTSSGAPIQAGVPAKTPMTMVDQMRARAKARKPAK